MLREGEQQGFVARHVVEHAEQKIRLARRIPDGFGAYPGQRKEAPQPLRLAGDEAQRRDRELLGRLLLRRGVRSACWRRSPLFHGCSRLLSAAGASTATELPAC